MELPLPRLSLEVGNDHQEYQRDGSWNDKKI
jgi:hypothetical protein